jgi:predicted GNAT family N-acyltransferase
MANKKIRIINPEQDHAEAVHKLILKSAKLVESMDMEVGAWEVFCTFNDLDNTRLRMSSEHLIYWIAVNSNERVIGVLVFEPALFKINNLFVDPAVHRQGVAGELWHCLKSYCEAEGIHSLVVNASSYAIPVYKRWGFERNGKPDKRMGITCYPMASKV